MVESRTRTSGIAVFCRSVVMFFSQSAWTGLTVILAATSFLATGGSALAVSSLASHTIHSPKVASVSAYEPRTSTIGTVSTPQVVRDGALLYQVNPTKPSTSLGGPYRFTGVDAYELNTWWGMNNGCGSMESNAQMQTLFSSLGSHAVVRVWFFQQFAINTGTHTWDWAAMDRTVADADAHGVHLIATLGNQDGTCDDDVWKSPSWYTSGDAHTAPGMLVPYTQWVQAVVARYQGNPAIMAWEPMNEPRLDTCDMALAGSGPNCWNYRTCPDERGARDALRSFYDSIGSEIRAIDPNHLISDGAPPIGGCGTINYADWLYADASPGTDLLSFHDYSGTTAVSPITMGYFTQGSNALNKPIFAGENGGVDTSGDAPAPGCLTATNRAAEFRTKMNGEFGATGAFVGWLFWDWGPTNPITPTAACQYSTWPGESMMTMLANYNPS